MTTGTGKAQRPPAIIVVPQSPAHVRRRARWIKADLDYRLKRLEGVKRFGMIRIAALCLFLALGVAPAWAVFSAREAGPEGSPAIMATASREVRLLHRPVAIGEVSPDMVHAALAMAAPDYCANGAGLRRAVAEQAFLWTPSRTGEASPVRAAAAAYTAFWIQLFWSEPRVVEVFLNTADWGDGYVGVEAAAQGRFGVPASALDRIHHALPLAVALDAPEALSGGATRPQLRPAASALGRRLIELERRGAFGCLVGEAPTAESDPMSSDRFAQKV